METLYKILKVLIAVLLVAVVIVGVMRKTPAKAPEVQAPQKVEETRQTAAVTETPSETAQAAALQVPDFTVYDAEGTACKLSDFVGKPIVLNFWASWCGPCKAEMPDFEESYKTYGDQIHFLVVNLTDGGTETVESASAFIAEQGYTFPVYFDTAMEAAYAYGISAIPSTFFIGADGALVHRQVGMMDAETLQKAIDLLLG